MKLWAFGMKNSKSLKWELSHWGSLVPWSREENKSPYLIHATWSKFALSSMPAPTVWVLVFFEWLQCFHNWSNDECFHNWSNDLERIWSLLLRRWYGFFSLSNHTIRTSQETQISCGIRHCIVEFPYKKDAGWDMHCFWKDPYRRFLTILIWPVIPKLSRWKSLNTADTES